MLQFEWDEYKAHQNIHKHGVEFDEAQSIFADTFSLTLADTDHSNDEDRFVEIGYSQKGRLLVVIYVERADRIRIISSRLATRNERRVYESRKQTPGRN